MKFLATLVATLFSSVSSSPAIVWSGKSELPTKQSSEIIDGKGLILSTSSGSLLPQVVAVFVVERDEHGSEGLTHLTSSGKLPITASKCNDASIVHHSVHGIESFNIIVEDAKSVSPNVMKVSIQEFNQHNFDDDSTTKKVSAIDGNGDILSLLSDTEILMVKVPSSSTPEEIDTVVSTAIDNSKIGSVVLTSIRGISEVKLERDAKAKKMYYEMYQSRGRRRLEDGNNGGDDDSDNSGMYFVYYTPNIFAGVLFFMFFIVVTYIGMGCMDMIMGQDVYVNKYPSIGREV